MYLTKGTTREPHQRFGLQQAIKQVTKALGWTALEAKVTGCGSYFHPSGQCSETLEFINQSIPSTEALLACFFGQGRLPTYVAYVVSRYGPAHPSRIKQGAPDLALPVVVPAPVEASSPSRCVEAASLLFLGFSLPLLIGQRVFDDCHQERRKDYHMDAGTPEADGV